jgi:PAS domain S-box-containing protein
MMSEASGHVEAKEYVPPAVPISSPSGTSLVDEGGGIDLPPSVRSDLLDFDAWGEILTTYGRTMTVAVALTDCQGQILGECHNAQPVWKLVHDSTAAGGAGCPFCITKAPPCTAVMEALQTGRAVRVRDQAGLTHIAVPLLLGKEPLGAIIAGQVFDRYPEQLSLRRVAKEFGVSANQLWELARKQPPVGSVVLQASGDLLRALGHAFLQQRYGAILQANIAGSDRRFRLLVEGLKDQAFFTMDTTGRVTSWNMGGNQLLGYGVADIMGQNFSCMFTPEDIHNGAPEEHIREALETGRVEVEGWCVREDREQFWANINITTSCQDRCPVRTLIVIVKDVTERRTIAIAAEETQKERARLQEKLLSHVSHELRTPLTAIYLFTTNLLDGLLGDLTPQQHEHLTFALENVTQLKSMVSDLLEITRVETNKLTIESQLVSPLKLISEVLGTCCTNAAAKNIRLCFDAAQDVPFVWADPARVRQILINLIDNGIKFTPEHGTVTVESRLFPEDDGFLRLSVSDTGCGISLENREIVFDRLAQVKGNTDASRSGLGLGLFIARDLVSRQGGRIWLESQLGHGSSFCFTLPVFSLAKLCAHVFTTPNLEAGSVTLIAVDLVTLEGAVQTNIEPEIRRILARCIHPAQDLLLPSMSDAKGLGTFFIVACTDVMGVEVIASRIRRELHDFDPALRLKPVVSSTTLDVAPDTSREEQIRGVTARIERLVQKHLKGKEKPK